MLPEDEEGETEEEQSEVEAAEPGGGRRSQSGGGQPPDGRETGDEQHSDPGGGVESRRGPAESVDQSEAEHHSEIGRDPLPSREAKPDRPQMPENGADGRELGGAGEEKIRQQQGGGAFADVEQGGRGGEALAARPKHV